ncbi:hypothetical protein HK104_005464 [Borealophlyctis nickersoniae]|nr:hypothetical protein HK104_005464 [Borealophlyctis nickersoniae]
MTSLHPSHRSSSRNGSMGEDNVDWGVIRDAVAREVKEWEQQYAWEEERVRRNSSEARRLEEQMRREQEDEQQREQKRQGKKHEAERVEYLERCDLANLQRCGQREKRRYNREDARYEHDYRTYLARSEEAHSSDLRDRYGPPRAGSGSTAQMSTWKSEDQLAVWTKARKKSGSPRNSEEGAETSSGRWEGETGTVETKGKDGDQVGTTGG